MPIADKNVIPSGDISLSDARTVTGKSGTTRPTSPSKVIANAKQTVASATSSSSNKPHQILTSGDISLSDAMMEVNDDEDSLLSPSKRYNLRSGIRAVLSAPVHATGDISLADATLAGNESGYASRPPKPVAAAAGTISSLASKVPSASDITAAATNAAKKAKEAVAGLTRPTSPTKSSSSSAAAGAAASASSAATNASKQISEAVDVTNAKAGAVVDKARGRSSSPTRKPLAAEIGKADGLVYHGLVDVEAKAAQGIEYAKRKAEDGLDYASYLLGDGVKFAKQKTGFGAADVKNRTGEAADKTQALKKEAAKGVDAAKKATGNAVDGAKAKADEVKSKIQSSAAATAAHDPHNPISEYLSAGKRTSSRSPSRSPTRTGFAVPSVAGAKVSKTGIGADMDGEEVMTL